MKNISLRWIIAAVLLVTLGFALNALGLALSHVSVQLLPAKGSALPWKPFVTSDQAQGGNSTVDLIGYLDELSFHYDLKDQRKHPFAGLGIFLGDLEEQPNYLDLSAYSQMKLELHCSPKNVLQVSLRSIDAEISDPNDYDSYRLSSGFLSCGEQKTEQLLDLRRLESPRWWLEMRGLEFSNQTYDYLDQVHSISIISSPQSEVNIYSKVTISAIELQGRNWLPLVVSAALTLLALGVFIVFALRHHTRKLADKLRAEIKREAELVAPIKPVQFESRQDRERADVLQFMSKEYTNADLSMDVLVDALGMNREKINNILREESALTFSGYLNKLRLDEAARLLSSKNVSVAEVAYAVGYKNVSYFNRLFKKAFACTPNSYKSNASA